MPCASKRQLTDQIATFGARSFHQALQCPSFHGANGEAAARGRRPLFGILTREDWASDPNNSGVSNMDRGRPRNLKLARIAKGGVHFGHPLRVPTTNDSAEL